MSLETVWEDELGEGYVYLPSHPGPGHARLCCAFARCLRVSIRPLRGAQIILDIDDQDRIIGIEIVR